MKKKFRYCRRCEEKGIMKIFEAKGRFSRICDDCRKAPGGWHQKKSTEDDKYKLDNILNGQEWRFGLYNKKTAK